jgi:hypothetical protein
MVGYRTSVIKKGVPKGACGDSRENAVSSILTPARPLSRGIAISGGGADGYCHGRRGRGIGKSIHVLRSKANFRGERRLVEMVPQDTEKEHDPYTESTENGGSREIWLLTVCIEPQLNSAQAAGCTESNTILKKARSLYRCKSNSNQSGDVDSPCSGATNPRDL